MTDTTHLEALQVGLSHELCRLAAAKTPQEITMRSVKVRQYEREIADEQKFLNLPEDGPLPEITDDELLAALGL
ncbi:hypothetical protein [Acidocella aminolytica]|uniref:Uncharacterized protein n=1 Tax=Acidocella aminolytica 101 = DSM 11237 TaxID=1120923 RepID=A0A0D6PF13_9PROT|nr:hypothetical protein [Acidocella aminolytica]GAN79793.1 hypothetical protein Aam_030_026 [Acidocella aminolytica 101 = DSM 11237]GBQ32068.1 hypothetical protein AA11237_0061 [Acidocella aminolytica 101 = DSM 11237]SHF35485.1 hypothetical protein SAMN02746095_02939 [Acidocella aminolytica 101 = DSM 11237]